MSIQRTAGLLAVGVVSLMAGSSGAQGIDPYHASVYSHTDLGSIPNVPSQSGGLCTLLGDTDVLLIGGSANTSAGAIYSVRSGAGCEPAHYRL